MEVAGFDGRQLGGVDEPLECGLDLGRRHGGYALLEYQVPGKVATEVQVLEKIRGQLAVG